MEYEYLVGLRKNPSWRLLNADSAPLIIGFFYRVFTRENRRTIPADEMTAKLEDYLFHLRRIIGEGAYPRSAKAYLDEWAGDETGYLRKFYPAYGEEAEYDLTPASEKVMEWLASFTPRQFVGTESRLLTVFRLLREIVKDAMIDPEGEIQRLEAEKVRIEAELNALKAGRYPPKDSTRIRERFIEAQETARRLLSDFRQVEENFRRLDRETREKIAVSASSKGILLDEIFGEQDAINGSDQGKTFRAFWQYIMSPVSQDELENLLEQVMRLPEVNRLDNDDRLRRIRFLLIDAGERVNATRGKLVEQLRKFLDDQSWLENKRIIAIIRNIEKKAVQVRGNQPGSSSFIHLDSCRAEFALPMVRSLFRPPEKIRVDDRFKEGQGNFDSAALYRQQTVNKAELSRRIRRALQGRSQVSLSEICRDYPVEKGLPELLTYMQLACEDEDALIDTDASVPVVYQDTNGHMRKAVMPEVIFVH